MKNNDNRSRKPISEKRVMFYAAAIAVLALTVTLMIAFLPKLISGMNEDSAKRTLRNPTVSQTDTGSSGAGLLDGMTTGAYTLGISGSGDEGNLYNVPANAALSLSATGWTADTLLSSLCITQADTDVAVDVTVSEAASGGFLISPAAGTWSRDTLYRVTLTEEDTASPVYSAAFQTEHPFSVKSIYPGNEVTDVPVDTGIEITFSDPVKSADFASFIEVTPAISGRFELYPDGKTVVIIPDDKLSPATQYAVHIKTGLVADNGQTLPTSRLSVFCTESRADAASDGVTLSLNTDSDIVTSPGTAGMISYNAYLYNSDSVIGELAFSAKIYAYPSADSAVAAMRDGFAARKTALYEENTVPTDGLSLVWEGVPESYRNTENSGNRRETGYIYLPLLEAGTYLVELSAVSPVGAETAKQLFCQVTPLRVYTESADGETLLWVNRTDSADGTPSATQGVEITATLFDNTLWMTEAEAESGKSSAAFRSVTALTDENGLARFSHDATDAALLLLRHVDRTLITCIQTAEPTNYNGIRASIYTDRSVFFSDDTVSLFGFLGRSYAAQTLPQLLNLYVGSSGVAIPVTVSEDGTFETSFPIEDWSGTYLSYRLTAETADGSESQLYYGSVRITQDEKPVYQMELSLDKLFYTYEDTYAVVTLSTSFFDGTPAAGLKLSLSSNITNEDITLVTDEHGQAVYAWKLGLPYVYRVTDTDAVTITFRASLIGYETVSLSDSASAYYFHSSGVFEYKRENANETRVTLNMLDTSSLSSAADFSSAAGYNDNTKGAPLDASIAVRLYKTEYIRTKDGTVYDPISKTFAETYTWDEKTTTEKTFRTETENGILTLPHYDASSFNGYYRYEVSWRDNVTGKTYTRFFSANRGRADTVSYRETQSYSLFPSADSALPGDVLTTELYFGNAPVTEHLPVLFTHYIGKDGRVSETVLSSGPFTHTFTFDESCTLGTAVLATVFDGEDYIQVPAASYRYDYTAANHADMTVSADRDSYKPGETARITVSAPALAGGTVLLSVVDEACFALGENDVDPLAEYFSSTNYGSVMYLYEEFYGGSYYSYTMNSSFGAYVPYILRGQNIGLISLLSQRFSDVYYVTDECEEESAVLDEAPATGGNAAVSDTYIRETFLDTAAFFRVTLDENGYAQTALTVPDNITSWRITAIGAAGVGASADPAAVSSGVRIGMTVSNTVCTLPFFVNVTLPDLFLCADEIAFSARAAGTLRAKEPDAAVTYHAELIDETWNTVAQMDVTAAASNTAWFAFDALPAGEYTAVVIAVLADTAADAVRLPFRVAETAQVVDYTETVSPEEIAQLSPAAYPLTLTFRDNTDALYYETLSALRHGNTTRTETLVAQYAARKIGETVLGLTDTWYSTGMTAEELAKELNQYSGFLPLNRYGEGDALLTAKIVYAVPDALTAKTKATLISLYNTLLSSAEATETEVCASLMALAAMGEPVLDTLYHTAALAADAPTDAKLYLAAAFAAAGDSAAAQTVLANVTAFLGRTMADGAFCISDASTEEAIRLTALALLPAVKIAPDTAYVMVKYLDNHTSGVTLYAVELAAFISYYHPTAKETASFSFDLGASDPLTVTLPRGRGYTLVLTKSDHAAFTLLSADDSITVDASYGAAPADVFADRADDETLHMEKTITPYDTENGIYKVTLTVSGMSDADSLAFSLSDTIPSGARYVGMARGDTSNSFCSLWLSNDGGQQMHGSLYIYDETYGKELTGKQTYVFRGSVSYLIRGAVKGTFAAEPALAVSRDADTFAATEGLTVTVRDGEWTVK